MSCIQLCILYRAVTFKPPSSIIAQSITAAGLHPAVAATATCDKLPIELCLRPANKNSFHNLFQSKCISFKELKN